MPRVIPICPHCGNNDPEKFSDNGLRPHEGDYLVLCTAECEAGETSYGDTVSDSERTCGMQFKPCRQCGRDYYQCDCENF